jgi:formylmethanofuran dehydrogenase subunit E
MLRRRGTGKQKVVMVREKKIKEARVAADQEIAIYRREEETKLT